MSPRYERRQRGGGGALLLLIAAAALVVAVLAIFTDVFSGKKAPDKDTDSPAVTQPADGEPDGTGDADNTAKDPEGDQKGGQSGNGDGNTDKSTVTTTKPAASNVITTDATPYQSGGVYIVGNAGYEMYNYVGSLAEKYQSTVNAVADSLSGVSNVYAMAIPLSSSITLPDSLLSDIPGSDQAQAEKDILAGMGQNIKTVPLHDALNAHRTEYIYFRTDHHWTALGAYYAYVQFCNVKGITPHDLSDYEVSQYTGFLGSFYNDGGKPQAMADDPDTVNAYHPVSSTAAMKYGTGLNFFKHRHPGRFFDVGMAEEHAVTFAAGLASQGLLPVVAIYSTFFQRAYDQIIHDVNLMQLDVLFAVDRAGLVPGDGATHQGIYDVAFFSNVNIPIFAPANYAELRYWLTYLVREAHGPRMIRYARGGENPALAALPCTGARYDVLDPVDGARIALVSYGAETEEIIAAKDLLAQHGVQADCVKLTQLYPLPDGVCDTLKHYDTILFAEDTVRTGGIGEQLGFAMQQCGWQGEFLLHAVDNSHLLHANVPELRKDQQLDAAALCADILNALKEKQA